MKTKRFISMFITLIMLIGMVPAPVNAYTDCDVTDNVIDITDKTVYEKKGLGSVKVTDIAISGAEVESASEDNTSIDIILSANTDPNAKVNVEFVSVKDKNMNISGHSAYAVLSDGSATLDITLKGQYSSMNTFSSTIVYTLNFSTGKAVSEPPARIIEYDTKSTYSGVDTEINLGNYFSKAKNYYLVSDGEKIPINGKTYTFKSFSGGIHTLVFTASNDAGECSDYVTVTVEVSEIESGIWIGNETSNGSLDYIMFTDGDSYPIEGLTATSDNKRIDVSLPKSYPADGTIKLMFNLTQKGDVPFVSTKTGTSGTSSGKAVNNKFTEKSIALKNGMASFTFYYYNTTPTVTSNNPETWVLNLAIDNSPPTLSATFGEEVTIEANKPYTLDLATLFTDADGDELTYLVSINGEAKTVAEKNYCFTPTLGGCYELEFFACDFMSESAMSYKVTLTVTNSAQYFDMAVMVPEDTFPSFFITSAYDKEGTDIPGDELTYTLSKGDNGYAIYTVSVPDNVTEISVRDEKAGGMVISATANSTVKLCRAQTEIIDFADKAVAGYVSVYYGEHKATGVDGNFLLVPDNQYTFTASPENTEVYSSKSETGLLTEDSCNVSIKVSYKNPKTVTTTSGASAKLYKYHNNYYVHSVYEPLASVDNENGTSTHYFAAEGDLSYRVSMEGRLTKAGYIKTGNSAAVLHEENDRLPTDSTDYYSETSDAAIVGDDSVLLNINQNNHLFLNPGETKTLKAYRAWQIIDLTYNNHIIEPDFHYNIVSGEDIVEITPYENQPTTNGSGNWRKITAKGEGTAVIEVTYDAISINGSSFSGLYGASDPARCGLFAVTVGNSVPRVNFGIESKTSAGSMVYDEKNSKPWDAEFDTVYFIGESGEITLSPSFSDGSIVEVAISGDKGQSFLALENADGIYNAPIVPGNNIIRVTTDKGTAYQIVRGDKVKLGVKNKTNPGKAIAPGDEVSITLMGLHIPVPKIAGTYNPGYKNNTDGDGGVHLHYSFGDKTIVSEGRQYNFAKEGTTISLTLPDNCKDDKITLTDGYIGFGVIGVKTFPDDADSHRNIPDSGGITRGNETTFHTRCILPDISVNIGMLPSDNTAPYIRENAPKSASLTIGGTYALSLSKIFSDRENDALTYTASVNNSDAIAVEDAYFTFTPNSTGTYSITFVATDSECKSDEHTITLTVKEKAGTGGSTASTQWDITGDEIDGYVTISFTDNGKRVQGETNLSYPKAIGTIISAEKVPFTKGDTVADVTLRLLDAKNFTYQHSGTTSQGFYLASIGGFTLKGISYDSFGEFDAGVGSGWMITLNKKFIEYGASEFEVKNGDVIKWQYTCQLGKDIGDSFYSGSASSSSSKKNNKTEAEKKDEIKEEEITKNIFTETTFADVKKDDWYCEAVKFVYENKLMHGTDKGFEPDEKMSRAMLVTVLYRMANPQNLEKTCSFTDVVQGMWYSDAISWAASEGIVKGINSKEFAPDSDVSREQTALIIYRFAKMLGLDVSDRADISGFTDVNEISDVALDAIKWAKSTELICGTDKNLLMPTAPSTRAQIATILMRFIKSIQNTITV